jgi:hypothetical protein
VLKALVLSKAAQNAMKREIAACNFAADFLLFCFFLKDDNG